MKTSTLLFLVVFACLPFTHLLGQDRPAGASGIEFQVTFPTNVHPEPITGHIMVLIARQPSPEPRLRAGVNGSAILGVDVDRLLSGKAAKLDRRTTSYPFSSIDDISEGDYYVQALISVYSECYRSDGHTVWVPWGISYDYAAQNLPGNLYSDVQKVHLNGSSRSVVPLEANHVIQPEPPAPDTDWIKHVTIESKLLTKFWGRSSSMGATVLLPAGYDTHPNVYYPVIYLHGHDVPFFFSTDPASQQRQARFKAWGLQTGYEFYQSWKSEGFPRFIAITFHQSTPYFVDSYSVNSANNGPYGDALVQELIPYLEEHFRVLRTPSSRLIEGASTGGWETLAMQLYYPDLFAGAWIFNPDPIDFRRYQTINIYQDTNAYQVQASDWSSAERPMTRQVDGQVIETVRSTSLLEEALGTHGRSGQQLAAWEAAYGPVDEAGYPQPLWNRRTGDIDPQVANYMREHGFDLREYAARNWTVIGPKLAHKLHFFVGDMDNYHLNLASYLFDDFVQSTQGPHSDAEFIYGRPLKGHTWHPFDFSQMVRMMADYIEGEEHVQHASSAWRY